MLSYTLYNILLVGHLCWICSPTHLLPGQGVVGGHLPLQCCTFYSVLVDLSIYGANQLAG